MMNMINRLLTIFLLLGALSSTAHNSKNNSDALWTDRLGMVVRFTPSSEDEYDLSMVIVNLERNEIISNPRIRSKVGKPSTIVLEPDPSEPYRLRMTAVFTIWKEAR